MAAEKGDRGQGGKGSRGWDDSLKDLQARIDALARRKTADGEEKGGHSSAEVARALRAHRQGGGDRPGEAIVYRRDLPRPEATPYAPSGPGGPAIALEEAVGGQEVTRGDTGHAFAIPTDVDEIEGAARFSAQFRHKMTCEDSIVAARIAAATGLDRVAPEDLVFFDIESTGLAYSPLFLIGAMVWEGDALVVHQYMARTYAEEGAAIGLFGDLCQGRRLLVSFNGKSYDLPAVKVRAAATGVVLADMPEHHLDLLHECRREWRDVLPDCRLQTLELHVCQRLRRGDIPSADIPRAYHAFVRSADAVEMVEVLKHNLLDLLTLADLMTRLPALEGGR